MNFHDMLAIAMFMHLPFTVAVLTIVQIYMLMH